MDLIYNKTILWFSLALGLLIITFGFVAGPISLLSLIDVVKGNKPFSELHIPRPLTAVIKRGPDVPLGDDNVYMSITNFSYDIYNILSIFLANKTQIEMDSIKRNLEPLSKLRQVYWESNRYVKTTEEQSNLKKKMMEGLQVGMIGKSTLEHSSIYYKIPQSKKFYCHLNLTIFSLNHRVLEFRVKVLCLNFHLLVGYYEYILGSNKRVDIKSDYSVKGPANLTF
ncbi:hypothetical protein A3Q34_05275 [Colwellia sp. PAMC 20917]|uniref:hypothetical protein n=1 Tax=Colwellia sp. PAMC 20917 TaxID=1816218 RepID=UPI000878A606|nr:hypothetical protein [Colwellia sp. PAMC 20917]AOW76321.1 hypothetical protein A3Q34_05275 [Colwellia sp. PAMC 20917]